MTDYQQIKVKVEYDEWNNNCKGTVISLTMGGIRKLLARTPKRKLFVNNKTY